MGIRYVAPQLLVDDLCVALGFYVEMLGFTKVIDWGGFYASVERDGQSIHLKCAPKTVPDRAHRRDNGHLDVLAEVTDVDALYQEFLQRGVAIVRPLDDRPWAARDCWVQDPDGYIIAFSQSLEASTDGRD